MGARMAANLLKNGHPLVVFDTNRDAARSLEEKGARVASSPAAVAKEVSAVVTMLPSSPHTRSVYTGPNGICRARRRTRCSSTRALSTRPRRATWRA